MKCPGCQADNRDGARFCRECGATFAAVCSSCGAKIEAGSKFCDSCGTPLAAAPTPTAATSRFASPESYTPKHLAERILTSKAALEGERKQVTVLFCDIANSTPLAERLGAETMHEVLNRFFDIALEHVHRYEGTVNQFLGDGFMALFGAPVAHEDHARRAILAAWSLGQALREHEPDITVRMGLNTGFVVVGSIGDNLRMDYTAVGDTTNLAARLQQAAEPGAIMIGEATFRPVRGLARTERLPPVAIKGKAEPVSAYRLVGLAPRRSAGREERKLSPLVGRTRELSILQDALREAEGGAGQVVGIVGDPGVGKSRLLHEFRHALSGGRATYLEGRCLSYGSTVPYLPVIDIVRANCGLTDVDTPEAAAAKVHAGLEELGMDPDEHAAVLLHLLGLKEGTDRLAPLTPQALRDRTVATLEEITVRGSRRRPLVFGVEDLHWIDPSSEAFLRILVERLGGTSILLVATYRPGYRPPWIDKSYATQLALRPLGREDGVALVRAIVPGERLAGDIEARIVARAEGNPFFLEELSSAVAQGAPEAATALPETIQDVLAARIDRLGDGPKRLLQTAAVLGREVRLRLLRATWDGDAIEVHLAELRRLEFLFERTAADEPAYVFKHALTQEVAYETLLSARRRALHTAAAWALESAYAARLEEVSGALAYHWSRAEDAERAIHYFIRVWERTARAFAHAEAAAVAREALAHADRLTPSPDTDRLRLQIMIRLGFSQHYLGRYKDNVEVFQAHGEQVERLGDSRITAAYHLYLAIAYSFSGQRELAGPSIMRAVAESMQCGDTETLGFAMTIVSLERMWLGQYAEGVELGRRAIALLASTPNEKTALLDLPWREPELRANAALILGWHYVMLGAFDDAEASLEEVLRIGEAAGDGRIQCDALGWLGWLGTRRGHPDLGLEKASRATTVSPEPYRTAIALGFLGDVHLERGETDQALAVLKRAVDQADQYRSRQVRSWFRTLLAEAYRRARRPDDARANATEAHGMAKETHFAWGIALATHILARIELSAGRLTDARALFEEALRGFTAIQARWDVGWAHVDIALLARMEARTEAAAAGLTEARERLRALGVGRFEERIERLARTYGLLSGV